LSEEDVLPDDRDTDELDRVDDDVAATGFPCRTRARAIANPVAAVTAAVRFATCARLRPASTLVDSGMSSLSRRRVCEGCESAKNAVRPVEEGFC
jgi:hypothetical protein